MSQEYQYTEADLETVDLNFLIPAGINGLELGQVFLGPPTYSGSTLTVSFFAALSAGDKTKLDDYMAALAPSGVILPVNIPAMKTTLELKVASSAPVKYLTGTTSKVPKGKYQVLVTMTAFREGGTSRDRLGFAVSINNTSIIKTERDSLPTALSRMDVNAWTTYSLNAGGDMAVTVEVWRVNGEMTVGIVSGEVLIRRVSS